MRFVLHATALCKAAKYRNDITTVEECQDETVFFFSVAYYGRMRPAVQALLHLFRGLREDDQLHELEADEGDLL